MLGRLIGTRVAEYARYSGSTPQALSARRHSLAAINVTVTVRRPGNLCSGFVARILSVSILHGDL
ncbi:hypothetical protein ACQGAO_32130 [Rhodococcus sp. 1.20]